VSIDSKDRLKYQRKEEVAQNKAKRPRGEPENAGRNTHDSDEEIEVDNTYQGEVEGMEGDGDNENDSDGQDPQKSKDRYTPLWKYVTKLSGGKGGGTGKFICHHCHKDYTGSYTRVRKHLCGPMYWDEG
jgi:hypothetical protein